jgi:hypothetical protein
VAERHYFIDDVRRKLPVLAPMELLPTVAPTVSSNLLGLALLLGIWAIVIGVIRHSIIKIWP